MQKQLEQVLLDSCYTEIRALKPGNVSLYSHGHGMRPADFFRSAQVIAPIICDPSLAVGKRIHDAMLATFQAVGCNTNLGILLLAAPLIKAFECRLPEECLQVALGRVLMDLSVEDAQQTFRAICIASPGGLGDSARHDVHREATVTLLEAMRESADRDSIARQYTNGFEQIFGLGVAAIKTHLQKHTDNAWERRWALVNCYFKLMSNLPDSHIYRKHGKETAENIRKRAECVESSLKACENRALTVPRLLQFDSELKIGGINPGTSADLTVGSLLAYQLDNLIEYGNKGWEEPGFSRE